MYVFEVVAWCSDTYTIHIYNISVNSNKNNARHIYRVWYGGA